MKITEHMIIKNIQGATRAYLSPDVDGIKDAYIDRYLNNESALEFYIPPANEKVQELTPECRIIADGREFTILRPDAVDIERSQDGKLWLKVMAVESWVLLDKMPVTVSNDPQNLNPADLQVSIIFGGPSIGGYPQGSAGSALTYLLQGQSAWTLGTVDVPGTHDLEAEKLSLLQNIKKVQEIWGGYLVWEYVFDETGKNITDRKLHLRSEATWQNYRGFQVRYAKNLKNITRTDNNDLVTRLYPFGQDDLDISSVNGGVKYLDNNTYSPNIYVGIYQNQEISDPQELKEKATEVLEKISQPQYTYRTGLVDLRTLPEFIHEEFTLGDMVDVVDPDVGTDRVRIQRHKYNVFQPWICELEIGEPEERLAAKLKNSFDAANFVKELLKPNPSISNLLKSFVDTFATTINGAKGNYAMVDGVSTWWDVDANGNKTGKIVRITPGGLGISKNGGQNFTTAITGDGILANAIICSALYALASGDGYTKLIDDGLHVYDDTDAERVHVGRWLDGIYRYGLKILASDGATVLMDDRGMLQTWQEGRADNVDSTHGLKLNVYIPLETRSIKKALLRFQLEAFRAYEKAAKSGGGSTSGPSSTSTTTNEDENIEIGGYIGFTGPAVDYTFNGYADADSHNHGITDGTALATADGDVVYYYVFNGSPHSHSLYNHGHYFTAFGHSHGMSHYHSTPNHSHGLDFGIYTDTTARGTTIKINGIDRTSVLGGPFNSSQNGINIAQYLLPGQWNTIELGSTGLGRIDATVFIQALMGI